MTAKLPVFEDLVELADSGETKGRILNSGRHGSAQIWEQMPVEGMPDVIVFTSRSTSWCYEVDKLRTDPRLREAIKRTAAMRRRS